MIELMFFRAQLAIALFIFLAGVACGNDTLRTNLIRLARLAWGASSLLIQKLRGKNAA